MKRDTSNNIRLGIFVIAALVAFTVAVYYIGSRQNLFGATFRISSHFHNVKGLQTGNNVRYAGINVGSVVAIEIVDDSTLRVEMLLEKRVQPYLRADARAQIGTDGLVGNRVINITPGSSQGPALESGAILPSSETVETQEMLNTLETTNDNIALLSASLLETVRQVNDGEGAIGMLLRDSSLAGELRTSLIALRQTTTALAALSADLRRTVAAVDAGEGNLGYLLRDTSLAYRVDHIGNEIDELLATEVAPLLSDLRQTGRETKAAGQELNRLLAELESGQGPLGTLLRDTSVARDLRETMESVNAGAEKFNENMEALQHNFLLRGFFKKQERRARKNKSAEEGERLEDPQTIF